MTAVTAERSGSVWWVAAGLSLAPAVSNGLARFAYGLILPAMREDLGWSYTEAGWINTANALGYLIGAIAALRLIARVGPHVLFSGGMVLTTLALFCSALTRDFWLQSVARLAAGIGGAPAFIAGGAMASTLFRGDRSRNALAIAIYFGGGGFCMLLTGASLPPLFEHMGFTAWPTSWLIMAGVASLSIIPAHMAAQRTSITSAGNRVTAQTPLPVGKMLFSLTAYFLFAVGYIVYLTFLVAWMRANGNSANWVAATWSIVGIAVMLSPFLWRPVLARSSGGGALALACLGNGIGTLMPVLIAGHVGLVLSAILFGGSLFIGPTAVTTFGRKNLPEANWGQSVALFTTVFAIGQTIGPVAAGAILDATSNLSYGLLAAGGVLVAASAVGSLQKRL